MSSLRCYRSVEQPMEMGEPGDKRGVVAPSVMG